MFLSAHTTAKTQNKQVSVLKSKYPKYSESGGMIIDVMSAAKNAITVTVFSLTNDLIFSKLIRLFAMYSLTQAEIYNIINANFINISLCKPTVNILYKNFSIFL